MNLFNAVSLDCKTVGFFPKISKEIGKAWRKSQSSSLFLASFQTFCLTARAYAKIRTVLQSTVSPGY